MNLTANLNSGLLFLLSSFANLTNAQQQQEQRTPNLHLNITALTYRGNTSILQCWTLEPPFSLPKSGAIGASVVSLGSVSGNASFIIQPPGSVGGYKNAPVPQWSIFLSGLAHITLLNSTDEAWIQGGRYGVVFADDVYTDGHYTTFPGQVETVLLGIPAQGGRQPEHEVLHEGACLWEDLIGGIE